MPLITLPTAGVSCAGVLAENDTVQQLHQQRRLLMQTAWHDDADVIKMIADVYSGLPVAANHRLYCKHLRLHVYTGRHPPARPCAEYKLDRISAAA